MAIVTGDGDGYERKVPFRHIENIDSSGPKKIVQIANNGPCLPYLAVFSYVLLCLRPFDPHLFD